MLEGLCRLIGAAAATGGGGRWSRPHSEIEPTLAVDVGLDSRGHELYMAYKRELGPGGDPIFQALERVSGQLVVCTRRQLVSDSDWYRSVAWNDYRRPSNIDDQLTSVYQISGGGDVSVIALLREPGEREFSPREQRLLSFFHAELGRLIGRSLGGPTEPSLDRLSPRLRQTLACLLDGDSEKQIALRLGLSHATIHQYVTALYRHFGVTSRARRWLRHQAFSGVDHRRATDDERLVAPRKSTTTSVNASGVGADQARRRTRTRGGNWASGLWSRPSPGR